MFSNNASSYQNVASSHTIQSVYIMYKKEDYMIPLLNIMFSQLGFHWFVWLLGYNLNLCGINGFPVC